jgi:alcohol dehydrogenase (cytochrome c)
LNWKGTRTNAILWANRNGFFYVLDRRNGRFLSATPFVNVNWASSIDESGRTHPYPAA